PTALADIAAKINALAEFTAVANGNGDGNVEGNTADVDATANTDTTGGGVLNDDLVLEVSGRRGAEVFNFQKGASINQVVNALRLVSDATGVTAQQSGGVLSIRSTDYGSKAFVDVKVITEGAAGTFKSNLKTTRNTGTDIDVNVNGVRATGDGNTFSINTATLDLTITVAEGSDENFEFDITGGGALFQIGPDVVSNQQARLGIRSVNTATLGGSSGRLFELASGGPK